MSWLDEVANEDKKGSHDIKVQKRKLLPRFSVNLLDKDYEAVQAYCEKMGMSCAALARMLLLKEISSKE